MWGWQTDGRAGLQGGDIIMQFCKMGRYTLRIKVWALVIKPDWDTRRWNPWENEELGEEHVGGPHAVWPPSNRETKAQPPPQPAGQPRLRKCSWWENILPRSLLIQQPRSVKDHGVSSHDECLLLWNTFDTWRWAIIYLLWISICKMRVIIYNFVVRIKWCLI